MSDTDEAAKLEMPPAATRLDPRRNAALFEFLHDQVGQVVLTTTRPERRKTIRVSRSGSTTG